MAVGWWSGGYIGVGDHPLVFVVIYLSFLLCVTVVIVAVCSIATVRWWLSLFCLSNIEIGFKSLMMLYVLIMRRFRDFKSRRLAFLCPWFVWVLILICCFLGWFRGVCWCVSECLFSFKLVGPRNISLHLIHKLFNISYWLVQTEEILCRYSSVVCGVRFSNSFGCFIVCGWCWSTSERWCSL